MKTMYRTDKYHIKKGHKLYSYCHSLCLSAAILYNRANYLLRQYATAVRDFEQYKPLTENQLTVWQMISDITGSTKYAPKGKWLTYGTLDYVLKSLKDPVRAFRSPKNYYFPIPDNEIKAISNWNQNSGWELSSKKNDDTSETVSE